MAERKFFDSEEGKAIKSLTKGALAVVGLMVIVAVIAATSITVSGVAVPPEGKVIT